MDLVSGAPTDAQSFADTEVAEAPVWRNFVSNEQVFRRGIAISSTVKFEREGAIAVAECLRDRSMEFEASVRAALETEFRALDVVVFDAATVNDGERVIVTLPSLECVIGARRYQIGATATVCQGDTNSKVWVKVSHFDDEAQLSEDIAVRLSTIAMALYSKCAKSVDASIEFNERFFFEIKAAYSSDEAISDVFSILLRSTDPKAAFDELRSREKLWPVARLLDFARVSDAFELKDDDLEREWLERNRRGETSVSSITPWTFRQGEAIVLIEANDEERKLRAWGLCHSDAVDVDELPPVRDAAIQLSGKLASSLARNL